MGSKDELLQLEERVQCLGVKRIEKRIARLENRSLFLFLRVRLLLRKIRFLKG